jgi:hypothetical protein
MKGKNESITEFGTILREKIVETYPDYLKQFPRYSIVLNMMEVLMNTKDFERMLLLNKFDEEIRRAIQTHSTKTIEIIPEVEPTILAWNSDYYFDNFFMWTDFTKKNLGLVKALELLAEASARLKMFISARIHLILYELTDYRKLSIVDALKLKQTFPITQLMNRVRDYFQIPIINKEDIDPIGEDIKDMVQQLKANPDNPSAKKYESYVQTFQAKTGIELTTDEKIEFIAEKLIDELISEDYDEIES